MLFTIPQQAVLRTKLQRDYLWEIYLPDILGIPGLIIGQLCQDITVGEYSMEELVQMRSGAFRTKYAGFFEIPHVTATFLKPIPEMVSTYFHAWRSLIVSDDGLYYPKSNYAREMTISLFDDNSLPVYNLRMVGVFPKVFPSYKMSYKSESVMEHQIEFNVDRLIASIL